MSGAQRPTYIPALGGANQGGNLSSIPTTKVSSRDTPSQQTLKRRRIIKRETHSLPPSSAASYIDQAQSYASLASLDEKLAKLAEVDRDADFIKHRSDDSEEDADEGPAEASPRQKRKRPELTEKEGDEAEAESAADSSSDDDDSEDDEAELQRELEALRREREAIKEAKAEAEEKSQLQRIAESLQETKVQRSWDEEAIFRVPLKEERNKKPKFINDAVRSPFHQRFLKKYIQ